MSRRITDADRTELARHILHEYDIEGRSIRQIAASLDRSYGFVHGVLRECDAVFRGRGGAHNRGPSV